MAYQDLAHCISLSLSVDKHKNSVLYFVEILHKEIGQYKHVCDLEVIWFKIVAI